MSNDEDFLQQVRHGLQRVEAPEGFIERLFARAEMREQTKSSVAKRGVLLQFNRPAWRAAYAAAAGLAITAGTIHLERARTEQRRADAAAAQFDTAMQVTNHALDQVSAKLEATEFGQIQRALESTGGGQR